MVLWGDESHVRKVSWREINFAEVLSRIGSQEFMGAVILDLLKVDLPTGWYSRQRKEIRG
jgi:hypothetical protein